MSARRSAGTGRWFPLRASFEMDSIATESEDKSPRSHDGPVGKSEDRIAGPRPEPWFPERSGYRTASYGFYPFLMRMHPWLARDVAIRAQLRRAHFVIFVVALEAVARWLRRLLGSQTETGFN